MIHRARQWRRRAQTGDGIVQIEFNNAFNNISRTAMLQAISNSFLEFLPYALFCYSKPCPLYAGDLLVFSKEIPAAPFFLPNPQPPCQRAGTRPTS